MQETSPIALRLPAAFLRFLGETPEAGREELFQQFLEQPGIHKLGPGSYAVLPIAGDPAVVDTAVLCARGLLGELRKGPAGSPLQALVVPGAVEAGNASVKPLSEFLLEDLESSPPELKADGVYLTGYATQRLESRWRPIPSGRYDGPSGRFVTLFRVEREPRDPTPWRNPEMAGRRLKFIPRKAVHRALLDHAAAPALRITGQLGSGKSRAIWEQLAAVEGDQIWTAACPPRSRQQPIGLEMLRRALDQTPNPELSRIPVPKAEDPAARDPEHVSKFLLFALDLLAKAQGLPVWLFCDDLEAASAHDLELLSRLVRSDRLGSSYRLVLIGRSGTPWPSDWDDLPLLEIPPMSEEEIEALGGQLFAGLSLPSEVEAEFLQASGGNPFALEEGIARLIHRKLLRRIYGSYFFRAGKDVGYEPSPRLAQHVEAEVRRLGEPLGLRLLAAAGNPVPADELRSASSLLGLTPPARWQQPYLATGWLEEAESPWGPGVQIACRPFAQALASTMGTLSEEVARQALGEVLAGISRWPGATLATYHLLRETPEAIPVLLKLARKPSSLVTREQLAAAFTTEIAAHRRRDGEAATELELLWVLLPLAWRMGALHEREEEVRRALELAAEDPKKFVALASLKVDLDQKAGRLAEAEATIREALKRVQEGDRRRQALLLLQLGGLLIRQERHQEAQDLLDRLARSLDRPGTLALAASCRYHLGQVALARNDLEGALEHHRAALALRREQKLLKQVGSSLSALGGVLLAMGRYAEALDSYREGELVLEKGGDEQALSEVLLGLGRALSRLGDFPTASQPLRRALALLEGKDDATAEARARLAVAENYLDLERIDESLAEAREAHFRLSLLSDSRTLGDADQLLGRILHSKRRFDEARAHFVEAVQRHRRHGDSVGLAFDQAFWLANALAREEPEEAQNLVANLLANLGDLEAVERAEMLYFQVFLGLEWVRERGAEAGDPLPPLRRAYDGLLRKVEHLTPGQRSRFLFQIPEHSAIVAAATRLGLSLPQWAS